MERLLTAQELESLLAVKAKTILAWARSGHLPCVCLKRGGRKSVIRFSPAEVERWLKKKKAIQII